MEDSFLKGFDHPIKLSVFEGPMDLLLFLIRKNEIDIYDIPVEKVTKQYIELIYEMEKLNLEVAGEFFVMAATLMEIKSRMLLPKSEQVVQEDEDEDEIDPRWELVHQLLEYKKFKEAANDLDTLIQFQQNLMPREVSGKQRDRSPRPLKKSDKMELWGAFNQVLRRLSDRLVVGEIEDENVTVSDRMEFILELSANKPGEPQAFTVLFEKRTTLVLIMYTFLACLELARLAKLRIWQDETYTEIYFEAIPQIDVEIDETTIDGSEDGG